MDVAGSASNGLNKGPVASQKTLFVGIEDGDERHFGQVESFAQEVDTHEDIEDSHAQVAHYLDTLKSVHVAVDVFAADAEVDEVGGQLFGHAFGEGGDQDTLVLVDGLLYRVEEVVDLVDSRPHLHDGV